MGKLLKFKSSNVWHFCDSFSVHHLNLLRYSSQSHLKRLSHGVLLIFIVSWLTALFFNLTSFLAALAEILSVKEVSSRKLYYVHYIDCEYCLLFL